MIVLIVIIIIINKHLFLCGCTVSTVRGHGNFMSSSRVISPSAQAWLLTVLTAPWIIAEAHHERRPPPDYSIESIDSVCHLSEDPTVLRLLLAQYLGRTQSELFIFFHFSPVGLVWLYPLNNVLKMVGSSFYFQTCFFFIQPPYAEPVFGYTVNWKHFSKVRFIFVSTMCKSSSTPAKPKNLCRGVWRQLKILLVTV